MLVDSVDIRNLIKIKLAEQDIMLATSMGYGPLFYKCELNSGCDQYGFAAIDSWHGTNSKAPWIDINELFKLLEEPEIGNIVFSDSSNYNIPVTIHTDGCVSYGFNILSKEIVDKIIAERTKLLNKSI